MARIHQEANEFNSTTANIVMWDTFTNVTNATTNVHTGSRALKVSGLASGTPRGANKKFPSAVIANFLRAYLYIVTLPSGDNQIMNFSNTTSLGTGQRCSISLASDGTLKLFNNTPAQIGSASAALSLNTWYMVELKCDTSEGTNLKIIEARLNGSVFATSSLQNQGTASSYSLGGNLLSEAQTTGEWWFDDQALNDSTGSFQNSYPGAGNIWQGAPTAAGDANGFLVQVGGTAGSANNYTRTNENPPDDATSYNASAVLNAEDLFVVDVSGVPSTATINCVMVGFRVADITGADVTTAIRAEIIKTSGGTKAQSADIIPNTTGWNSLNPSSPRMYPIVLYQDPDNVNWNPATWIPQVGYTVDVANVRGIGVTNIWISVDYTPAAPAATTRVHLPLLGVA